ncbi:hypothetical protein HWV03_03015 [Moritella sp. 36]|uniref:rhamnan synthesis F family protein n=1 Tax=Moritella sp. 36 TaxID=2746233 RepID=UPI001BA6A10A|nr:rhamnan synthesis F family protein [Moritella sp. 36]QUM87859.1 hypothetical protein HWV03_03015 [Moritella sp. 36]
MKRICLFAGYNKNSEVQPYVLDYLKEMSLYCDVYYLSDGDLSVKSLMKIKNICIDAWVLDHGKYDFGSYSELMKNYVGWNTIEQYDELIIANDSAYCVNSFQPVFDKMSQKDCSAWGLLATDEFNLDYNYAFNDYIKIPHSKIPMFCIGSYFMAFKKEVFIDNDFQMFFNNVEKERDRNDVCLKYEMGLTKLLLDKDIKMSSYIDTVYKNVSIYNMDAFRFVYNGFPLIKIRIFKDNPLSVPYNDDNFFIGRYCQNDKIFEYIENEFMLKDEFILKKDYKRYYNDFIPPIFRKGKRDLIKEILPPILTQKIIRVLVERKLKKTNVLKKINVNKNQNLMIFFNVAIDTIGGGMLSIDRFVDKSIKLEKEFDFKVRMSGLPLSNNAVSYSKFESTLEMEHFNKIIQEGIPDKVTLNLPEVFVKGFLNELTEYQIKWLHYIPELRINILDQNHDLFPLRREIERLKELTLDVTVTSAHEKYATQKISDEYQVPLNLLTPFLPEFIRRPHSQKSKVIAISPDDDVNTTSDLTKNEILSKMISELPDYKFVVINDISLNEYKELISDALFTITFGEGYDGYFIEPSLSDSVSFAVYNETFFPVEFKDSNIVYPNWESLYENIVRDIRLLESDHDLYKNRSDKIEVMTRKHTNSDRSEVNLHDFYNRKVDFLPSIFNIENYKVK